MCVCMCRERERVQRRLCAYGLYVLRISTCNSIFCKRSICSRDFGFHNAQMRARANCVECASAYGVGVPVRMPVSACTCGRMVRACAYGYMGAA